MAMKTDALAFWEWFRQNQQAYLNLEEQTEADKNTLLQELLLRLQAYCEALSFEIGGSLHGKKELIITADGDSKFFETVHTLIQAAPRLRNWKFIALVPPRGAQFEFGFEDVTIKADDIWFMPLKDRAHPEIVAIKVCTSYYDRLRDFEWLRSAMYKILSCILGEKTFALDLHYVDLGALPPLPEKEGMIQITQLPKYIDWKKNLHQSMIALN